MTLRRTEIIEWSTTPKELRRIADEMEEHVGQVYQTTQEKGLILEIYVDEGQWQAEQVEED